ncbi:MAG: GTP-binding protein [Treponema sp. CETP13]|nr:MAG: GTP-binding protein [Treponema sp. CETP13]
MDFSTQQIRNVSIAGHGQTGKTTLAEHLLFTGGVISETQTIESGKTVSDYTPEEIQHKISIYSSLTHIPWNNCNINIWDTPGASGFVGEVIAAFRSCEMALMLVDGRTGAQIETIKLWRRLDRRNKPRMVFVNRIEDERTDYQAVVKDIHKKFQIEACPITIPMMEGSNYKGVIDVLHQKAFFIPSEGQIETETDIPEKYLAEVKDAREILSGAAAEGNEDLLVKFIDEGELSTEEIDSGLKEAYLNNRIVPFFAGDPINNSGLVPVLNFISTIAPSPGERVETAINEKKETIAIKISPDDPIHALVVKTSNDKFSGCLSYLKVISGVLESDSELYNVTEGQKEKIGKLYRCQGKNLEEIKKIYAGDIGIAAKLSYTKTSDTLSEKEDSISFIKLRNPGPVFRMAVTAKDKKAEIKMGDIFYKMAEEDHTFKFGYNAETKQNVIEGMGELHLKIKLDKIKNEANIDIETSVPRVAYRETILRKSQSEYTHKKQSGGHGQFARVDIAIEPMKRGEGYKFTNAVFGGAIAKGYIPGVEKGIQEALEHGVLAGYPVVDVATTVLDGKQHPVDSSEMAFKIAARNAFKIAMRNAGPTLLEPIMNVTVWVETKYLGDIMSDFSSKRGRIMGQEPISNDIEEIRAQAPQSELLRYAIDLRSLTSGTGSFEAQFSHYDPISGKLAEKVITTAQSFMEERIED